MHIYNLTLTGFVNDPSYNLGFKRNAYLISQSNNPHINGLELLYILLSHFERNPVWLLQLPMFHLYPINFVISAVFEEIGSPL